MIHSIRIAALFTTALAACTQVIEPLQHVEAFCQEKGNDFSLFAAGPEPNGGLIFAISKWEASLNFAVFGTALSTGPSRWRFEENMRSSEPDERCAVDITRTSDHSYTLVFDKVARCAGMGGHRRTPESPLSFPGSIRQTNVTDKILQPDLFMRIGHCAPS
jgi:hypothetical protein